MRNDPALAPAHIPLSNRMKNVSKTPIDAGQGIPSIEVTSHGRIFVNFYSGQDARSAAIL